MVDADLFAGTAMTTRLTAGSAGADLATTADFPLAALAGAGAGATFATGLPFTADVAPLMAAAEIPFGASLAGFPFAGATGAFPDAFGTPAGAPFFALLGLVVNFAIATNVSFQVGPRCLSTPQAFPGNRRHYAPLSPKCLHAPLHTEKATFPLASKTLRLSNTPTVLPALVGKDVQV